jgi:hypothetical protein
MMTVANMVVQLRNFRNWQIVLKKSASQTISVLQAIKRA